MIDSIWSLLAARYSDPDSWLDLKYIGTNLVERLTNYKHSVTVEIDSISELKVEQKKIHENGTNLEFNSKYI